MAARRSMREKERCAVNDSFTQNRLKVSRAEGRKLSRGGVKLILDVVLPALAVCWAIIFALETVAGPTGLRTLRSVRAELSAKRAEVEALTARREALERTATQLNRRSIDPDLLDEKLRSVLGYAAKGDIVIPRDELDRMLERARKAVP
ncbi:MAG: septum formation initiator family protein [Parvularculaceae bacterium]|nr:septum formation initiator family protein [Parvularculaceae bacterium]